VSGPRFFILPFVCRLPYPVPGLGQEMESRLRTRLRLLLAVVFCVLCIQNAVAGAPLKGIDVKLGKNPGGGCAARTTDGAGKANFGVWPKGNYTLSLATAAISEPASQTTSRIQGVVPQSSTLASPKMHLTIIGATTGKIERDVAPSAASARALPIEFSLDGKEELVVVVTAAP